MGKGPQTGKTEGKKMENQISELVWTVRFK